jgi:hypothetical protein
MTLVLTELSPLGIAMAADSAVTRVNTVTGAALAIPNAARKLHVIPNLRAGISCWGLGQLGTQRTDEWIEAFIQRNHNVATLGEFAQMLATEVENVIGPSLDGQGRLGFHLAGFVEDAGEQIPTFYHVHDGPSTEMAGMGINVDPHHINANQDIPPSRFRIARSGGQILMTRNGDFQLYALLFDRLTRYFEEIAAHGVFVPQTMNIEDRADFLVFQIRLISDIYRMSNLIPGIGGGIHYLAILPSGIQSTGIRYF